MKFFLGFITPVFFCVLLQLAGTPLTVAAFSVFAGWMFVSFSTLAGYRAGAAKVRLRYEPYILESPGPRPHWAANLGRAMDRGN